LKTSVVLLLLVFLTLGCESAGQRAVKQAEADAIRLQAQQEQAEAEAAEARKQADWEGTKASRDAAKSAFFFMVFVSLGLAIAIGAFVIVWRVHRLGRAVQRKADLASRLVQLNAKTGTYPVMIVNGAAHILETGAVIRLGESRNEVPQLMDHSAFTRQLALAGRTAERIAKTTKDAQAGDLFGTAAGVLPSNERGALWREKRTVEESPLPGVLKGAIVQRLESQEKKHNSDDLS
jgi:hypothetical protein